MRAQCERPFAERPVRSMSFLKDPIPTPESVVARSAIIVTLAASAISLCFAPRLMPASYSWISNVISESAAQGVRGAWLARAGLLAFGFAVLWQALVLRRIWSPGAFYCHLAFAIFMLSAAAFSHRPWIANVAFDRFEDLLHSVAATGMGFAFALGVALRQWQRIAGGAGVSIPDLVAIACSVVLPVTGVVWPELDGLLQRAMFLVAYVWYGREVWLAPSR